MRKLINQVTKTYETHFGDDYILVSAPGRINFIGEHTDYNMGFVFPAAIDRAIYFAIGPSKSLTNCTCISLDENQTFSFDINEISSAPSTSWKNYILGVVAELQNIFLNDIGSFNVVFAGNIPIGAGMSSSAALECGLCFGLDILNNLNLSRTEMALISQAAEHNYAGVKCGIMDQYASLMGKNGQAFILDCKSLDINYFDVKIENYSLVLCNSNVSHSLAESAYNERRLQCEEGVRLIKTKYPKVDSLRDVTLDMLSNICSSLDPVVFRRCKYIIEENDRVLKMGIAFKENDFQTIGRILNEAHAGIRDDYEITCKETDFIANRFEKNEHVLGARQMGGGFGGCILAIVKTEYLSYTMSDISEAYSKNYRDASFLPVEISDGCHLLSINKDYSSIQ